MIKKTKKTAKAAKTTGPKLISLKEICRDLDVDPRAARMKLRKNSPGNAKKRWEWPEGEIAGIKKLLK